MNKLTFLSILLLVTALSACSSKPTTKIDFNSATNFTEFSSYQFILPSEITLDSNPIMSSRIQSAISDDFSNKALSKYEFVDDNSADLTVSFHFSQQEKRNNSSFSIGFGTGRVSHSGGASVGVSTSVPINSDATIITTIVIDISHAGQAVWHGRDSYEASGNLSTTETDKAVADTVARLLANFPPKKLTQ